jgi:hypothetical protein
MEVLSAIPLLAMALFASARLLCMRRSQQLGQYIYCTAGAHELRVLLWDNETSKSFPPWKLWDPSLVQAASRDPLLSQARRRVITSMYLVALSMLVPMLVIISVMSIAFVHEKLK